MRRKNRNNKLETEKAEIESKIAEIDAENSVVKSTIPKVKKRDRLSIILFGPEKGGKSTIAYFLSEEQQRGVVNLSELYSWGEKSGTPTFPDIAKYLTEKEEEWKVQEELEKKKKKGKKDEVENPNQVLEWKYLPKELLVKMIVERTSHEDCNAGIIFDNLTSEYWRDEKVIVDAICDALSEENIHLISIALTKDENGLEYCENFRYKMRKEMNEKPVEKEILDKTFVDKDNSQNKQKKGKKKELTEEEKKKLEEK